MSLTQSNIHQISQELAQSVLDQQVNEKAIVALSNIDPDELLKELDSDNKKKAFWINVYNGLIYAKLSQNPDLYQNRGAFFSDKILRIAGMELSFDDIEHDILRKSTWKYSFGYLPNIFSGSFESKNEVEFLDPRIHFALNCGAKSCPPVRVYDFQNVHDQLDYSAKSFLLDHSVFNKSQNKLSTTTLFNWFRGDFGGENGIIELLRNYQIIPSRSTPDISFTDYDWSIDLSNTSNF